MALSNYSTVWNNSSKLYFELFVNVTLLKKLVE